MPQRDYKIIYSVDNTGAITSLAAIKGELRDLQYSAGMTANALAGVGTAMGGPVTQGAATAKEAFGGIRGAMFDMLAAWQIASIGLNVAEVLNEPLKKAREHAKELADEIFKIRDASRELANLKGHNGPDDVVLADQAKLMLETGMTAEEAKEFEKKFEGTIPAAREEANLGKKLGLFERLRGDDDGRGKAEQELRRESALFGVRTGLDGGTAGDLGASLAVYERVKDGRDAAGKLASIGYGLNEGRGDLKPLSKSLMNTAGTIVEEGGQVNDLGELAAILGVMSIGNTPDTAGHRITQASRELRRFSDPKRGKALKDAGITKDDSFMSSLEKMKAAIGDEDEDIWLQKHGFQNREGNKGMIFAMRRLDMAKRRIAKGRKIRADGEKEQEINRNFRDNTQAGRKRVADAQAQSLKMEKGMKEGGINIARELSKNRLIAEGKIGHDQGQADALADWGGLRQKVSGGMSAYDRRIEEETRQQLKRSAKEAGIGKEEFEKIVKDNGGWDKEGAHSNTAAFNAVSREIEARGENAYGPKEQSAADRAGWGTEQQLKANEPIVERLDKLVSIEESKRRDQQQAPNGRRGAPPQRAIASGAAAGATAVNQVRP